MCSALQYAVRPLYAVSVPNDTALNGLVKTLEMAIKSYKTPPNKLQPLFFPSDLLVLPPSP